MAQTTSQMHIVGSAEFQPNELISNTQRDKNGEVCAGIMIVSDLEGLSYQSNNGIVKIDKNPGKDLLYVSPTERVIEIYKFGYEPLRITLSDLSVNLKSGQVWQLNITGDKKLDLIPINILTSPSEAIISIDGELKGTGTTFQVSEGEHQVKIEKDGYLTIDQKIIVSSSNNLFDFNLEQLEPVKTTIKSVPTNANISIDGIDKGNTDKDLFLFPGSYSLLLRKSGYIDINETITIKETGQNNFSYNLSKNSVTLTLNINPQNAEVKINKEDYSNRQKEELAPGRYLLEIGKDGYKGVSEYIELELSKPFKKNIALEQKTGSLQLTVEPIDASVKLKKGKTVIKSWIGSEIKRGVPVGNYLLEVTKTGYTERTKIIQIKEKETTIEDILLERGSSITSTTSNQISNITDESLLENEDETLFLDSKNSQDSNNIEISNDNFDASMPYSLNELRVKEKVDFADEIKIMKIFTDSGKETNVNGALFEIRNNGKNYIVYPKYKAIVDTIFVEVGDIIGIEKNVIKLTPLMDK